MTLYYKYYGIFLIMSNAGFLSSAALRDLGSGAGGFPYEKNFLPLPHRALLFCRVARV